MAVVNQSSLETNFYIRDTAISCAGIINDDEFTDTGSNADANVLCRADIRAQQEGGAVVTTGTWSSTSAGFNSWKVLIDGIVRDATGADIDINMTYRQLIDLKDAGLPVETAFGRGLPGTDLRVGMALITRVQQVSDPKIATVSLRVEFLGVGPRAWETVPAV